MTDPGGETARYRYDEAGNRLGVDRFASSTLSVLSVVPVRAAAGTKITLSGTGFSTTAANNAVSFGGKAATVATATATRLVVTVPVGAVDGKVAVKVGSSNAQSVESFALAGSGPAV
ncbi:MULTISPECIES: IPT/TIG domain-containing protein [unclassified Streptomyces]|uniref:IPT/TIG domain-containing protein n=1 Tax=unclassified Streptomyces TaxID=2593676 RepID=UPI00386EAEF0